MVKKDLVHELWLKFPDFRKKDLELIVDLLFEELARSLQNERRIEIRGFGRFVVKAQKGRLFRNPKTGEIRELPPRKRIIFKPGKDLKDRLNQEALASLDLGTQTFRLLIAKEDQKRGVRPILRRRENVRLGEGLSERGEITKEAFARGLAVLRSFKNDLKRSWVKHYLAAGTAVFRKAQNAPLFLAAAEEEGIRIRVLSPEEEASFTARGVLSGMRLREKETLIVDVGGGSSEFIFCLGREVVHQESLDLGAVTYTKAYFKHEIPKSFEIATFEGKVREVLANINPPFTPKALVATGGTASCMMALALGLDRYHPDLIHGKCLYRDDLEELFERLRGLPYEERRTIKGMEPGREDIILAGIKIYGLILETFSLRRLCVSETGILEGLLLHLKDSVTNISASK